MSFNTAGEFIKKVKESSGQAVKFGREAAIRHCVKQGMPEDDAEILYDVVREMMSQAKAKTVLNMDPEILISFIGGGKYRPPFNCSQKKAQAERAMGCLGLSAAYAMVTEKQEGDRGRGCCSVVLSGMEEKTILLAGDPMRVRNPDREDYVSDPFNVLYVYGDMASCRASAAICSLAKGDLMGGADVILRTLADPVMEYGRCEAMVFSEIGPQSVSIIITDSDSKAEGIRHVLDQVGRAMPVFVSGKDVKIVGTRIEEDEISPKRGEAMLFRSGDRVAMKPSAANPRIMGTILEVSDGEITVQWDDSQRAVYGAVEAMMRLMPAPSPTPGAKGMVVYALPGMDVETVRTLCAVGVDPVTVFSLASHARPASETAKGWEENLVNSLKGIGIEAHVVDGFSPDEESTKAFRKRRWVEGRLRDGCRLVIDASPRKILVMAGSVDEYVVPSPESKLVFE